MTFMCYRCPKFNKEKRRCTVDTNIPLKKNKCKWVSPEELKQGFLMTFTKPNLLKNVKKLKEVLQYESEM